MAADRPTLDSAVLRDAIACGHLPWRRLDVVTETTSTNADLLARAHGGEDIDGAVLIAEHQTAGRGRNGRTWSDAPRSQLSLSVGVSAAGVPVEAWGWLPLATGLAVVDAVVAVTGVRAGLKWPNDVLAGDGKLAGILAEVAAPAIVVGIGLNVTLRADEVGESLARSLTDLGVDKPDRTAVAVALLHSLGERVVSWRAGDRRLMADYRAASTTVGRQVRAELPGGRAVVGLARSVDDQGRLCIEANGGIVAVSAGDVSHLRPSP